MLRTGSDDDDGVRIDCQMDDDPEDEDYRLPQRTQHRMDEEDQFEAPRSFRIPHGDVNKQTIEQKEVYVGKMKNICKHCKAMLFDGETSSMCCSNGRIKLPPLPQLPPVLIPFFYDQTAAGRDFRNHILFYNNAFCFTSTGMKRQRMGWGPRVFKIQGVPYHRIGHLLAPDGEVPVYAQIYLLDTREQAKVRMGQSVHFEKQYAKNMLYNLSVWLRDNNEFAKVFKYAQERYDASVKEVVIVFEGRGPSNEHTRKWNLPSNNGMCGLIENLEDVSWRNRYRDIILEFRNDQPLFKVNETHRHSDCWHYVLFFPHGQPDGWTFNNEGRTPRAHYKYRFMQRVGESDHIFRGGMLYQKFLIDMYSKVLMQELRWLANNQEKIRGAAYQDFKDVEEGNMPPPEQLGKLIVLPSTQKGSNRFMKQLYHDFMAVVRVHGAPTLFVTMTCNPQWKEIQEQLFDGQYASDRPGLCNRVFQLKLRRLVDDLYKNEVLGAAVAKVYVIEFQKRGLPHAHILIWFHPDDIPHSPADIDKLISSEIPDPAVNPVYVSFCGVFKCLSSLR